MFLIIFKVLHADCCHGNNKAITPTGAHYEEWVTLFAYQTTEKVYIHTFSFAIVL